MKIADQPQLIALIIVIIGVINVGLGFYVFRKQVLKEKRAYLVVSLTIALSYSIFLYLILKHDDFLVLYAVIAFMVMFVGALSYIKSIKKLHSTWFKRK